ncbi:CD80-like immunoglobulin C2-set [Trinorchestia longiramus]|nr:CD80-like immunoglobulin C2-set [Trinorchestia longiramus]
MFDSRPIRARLVVAFVAVICACTTSAAAQVSEEEFTSTKGLENSPMTTVQAVVGEAVLLPCDVTPPTPSDDPMLVLFFFRTKGTPIYSVDARGRSTLYSGKHWKDVEQLGNRATVQVRRPGHQGLYLTKLTEQDGGEYRCRVDFKSSPTRNVRIYLQIIVPPRHILVTSSWDEGRIVTGRIGPYPEGADVTLACQVTGGSPPPSVTWWQAGSLMDDVSEVTTEQVTRNLLRLPRLSRDDLLRKLTCVAANSNLTAPLSSAVVIDIAFPPNSVRISSRTSPHSSRDGDRESYPSSPVTNVITVRANREEYLTCESTGSRPQAQLVWKKNGIVVEGVAASPPPFDPPSSGRLTSLSTLQIYPTVKDNKAVVSCKAFSPKLPEESIEDSATLNVLYQPVIKLFYSSKVEQSNLEEGDDFSFECSVEANPGAGQIQWARDGVPIIGNNSAGIEVTENRLIIIKSTRFDSGSYTCAAANSEGVTTSNSIDIKIKFVPVCSNRIQKQYGAGKSERIDVTCWVDSHPAPLTFRWAFNSSTQLQDISKSSFSSHGMSSTLSYLPNNEHDFGSLLCWAANDVGLMKQPCVMQIVPAAKPEKVRNCEVFNNASMPRSVALASCLPGWDGGLAQTFTLEIRESRHKHSRVLASVQHSPTPVFNMKRLKHGEEYLLIITAVNSRGTSPPVTLSYRTPPDIFPPLSSDAQKSDEAGWVSWTLFIAVVIGVFVTVTLCLGAVVWITKLKPCRKLPAKIVYAGPIRDCDKGDKTNPMCPSTIVYCDKHNCEVDDLTSSSYLKQVHSESEDSLTKQQLDDLNNKDEIFRSSGSDIRIATPCNWNSDLGSSCEDSYFRNSGPYHINSLSPPSPPHHMPCTSSPFTSSSNAPLASSDSLGRYSSSSSSRVSSVSASGMSAATVAMHPDYRDHIADCRTPLMSEVSKESAV